MCCACGPKHAHFSAQSSPRGIRWVGLLDASDSRTGLPAGTMDEVLCALKHTQESFSRLCIVGIEAPPDCSMPAFSSLSKSGKAGRFSDGILLMLILRLTGFQICPAGIRMVYLALSVRGKKVCPRTIRSPYLKPSNHLSLIRNAPLEHALLDDVFALTLHRVDSMPIGSFDQMFSIIERLLNGACSRFETLQMCPARGPTSTSNSYLFI